jgi:hypothetical protein
MDPKTLFPAIAAALLLAALWRRWRLGRWRGAAATWLLMALIFASVAAWLRFGPPMTLVG